MIEDNGRTLRKVETCFIFGGPAKKRRAFSSCVSQCFFLLTEDAAGWVPKALCKLSQHGPVAQWSTRPPTERKIVGSTPARIDTFCTFPCCCESRVDARMRQQMKFLFCKTEMRLISRSNCASSSIIARSFRAFSLFGF